MKGSQGLQADLQNSSPNRPVTWVAADVLARDAKMRTPSGAIAQLGERIVRNDEVVGSIPTSSTNSANFLHSPRFGALGGEQVSVAAYSR